MRAAILSFIFVLSLVPQGFAQTARDDLPHFANQKPKVFGRVSFDGRSLMIDGERLVIWSGEFHAYRLPSPDLWRDILQKMKATGFNTVAIYVAWGYHSPKQGVYDFTGIRDVGRVLEMAAEEGLYVITRAGPYVNAELSRGGFPGWLVNQRARARTDDPDYLAAADEWLSEINRIIAEYEINRGKGTVILHQIENELALTTPAHRRYMDHLYAKAREDGITIPIFHNDQGRNGYWTPAGSPVDGVVEGPVDLYAFDGYPGGACTVTREVTRNSPAPDWGFYGPGGAKGGASASPNTPGFAAEFGGGWFDYWGSNGGYECNALQRGKYYQRVFYGTNLANGIYIQSFYMTYGGTSWGWLAAPVVYTSYDYGAAISEPREVRPKALELKQLGQMIAAVPDLAGMIPAGPVTLSSDNVQAYHNKSPETDARFLMVTHAPSNKQTDDRFTITADLPDGRYQFPQEGTLQLNGFDAKWLLAGADLGGQRLVYSTSELQTALTQDNREIALFYGRTGEDGETVFRYESEPAVSVIEGEADFHYDEESGDLRFNYAHGDLIRIKIEPKEKKPFLLLIGDEAEGVRWWRQDTPEGPVLERGPALVRSAEMRKNLLSLTGDVSEAMMLEVFAPKQTERIEWNGATIEIERSESGSFVSAAPLPGPGEFVLPALDDWRMAHGAPEAAPDFDDSDWIKAGASGNASITRPPNGQPNLAMDAHGFHHGDVWYRGRFKGTSQAEEITLQFGAGAAGLLQLWFDGAFVGQHVIPGGQPRPVSTGVATFSLPKTAQKPGEHVLSIMVRNNGHNWDLNADDFHKEARGLVFASLTTPEGNAFAVPIDWKIQGNRGGEDIADPVRGVVNNGGLYGERQGWHLPEFDDSDWKEADIPARNVRAGVTWYRSRFELDVPKKHDATIALAFGDTSTPRSDRQYRALIFVNGWHMGQFVSDIGPQKIFPVPEGILNHRGPNTIALAVTSNGGRGNALENVRLVRLHYARGGVPVSMVEALQHPEDLK